MFRTAPATTTSPRHGVKFSVAVEPWHMASRLRRAGYTFGAALKIGSAEHETVISIIECHVLEACIGGDGASQCALGYIRSRCAHPMMV